MTRPVLFCRSERRRDEVRRKRLNGLDFVEVSDDQTELTVYLIGEAPDEVRKENVQISGGQRVRDIEVVHVRVCDQEEAELRDIEEAFDETAPRGPDEDLSDVLGQGQPGRIFRSTLSHPEEAAKQQQQT